MHRDDEKENSSCVFAHLTPHVNWLNMSLVLMLSL